MPSILGYHQSGRDVLMSRPDHFHTINFRTRPYPGLHGQHRTPTRPNSPTHRNIPNTGLPSVVFPIDKETITPGLAPA